MQQHVGGTVSVKQKAGAGQVHLQDLFSYQGGNMTSTTSEMQQLGKATMDKLRNGINDWGTYQRKYDSEAWLICNSLAFSTTDAEIEFLTGHVDLETGGIEIAAYTKDLLIYSEGVPDPMKGPVLQIVPRQALTGLEVHSAPEVIPSAYLDHFDTGSYAVSYGASLAFTLPLEPRRRYPELDAFAPELWKDLLN